MNVAATEGGVVENCAGVNHSGNSKPARHSRCGSCARIRRDDKGANQAVKRNKARFPEDFAFRLTADEVSQTEKSRRAQAHDQTQKAVNRSQIVTGFRQAPRPQIRADRIH
jgi:hypothetical protein